MPPKSSKAANGKKQAVKAKGRRKTTAKPSSDEPEMVMPKPAKRRKTVQNNSTKVVSA